MTEGGTLCFALCGDRATEVPRDWPVARMAFWRDKKQRFAEAALPHLDAVYRFAAHLSGHEADAQDITQECFHQAYRKFHQFRDGTNCKAWLFRIARNAFIDRVRRRSREPRYLELGDGVAALEVESDGDAPSASALEWRGLAAESEQAVHELFGDEVARSLRELPEAFRVAVILCDVDGMSYHEIAEILGCPVGTVRSRISRARSLLKTRLHDYARDLGFARQGEET